MKTDYQNINPFEVAMVATIAVGFVLVGAIIFATLTPNGQAQAQTALEMFDIHEEFAATVEGVEFVIEVPNNFYEEFYIAFTQTATLSQETFEVPSEIAVELSRNFSLALNALADGAVSSYQLQGNTQIQQAYAQPALDGKVMGAMIDLSDKLAAITATAPVPETLKFPYQYPGVDLGAINLSLSNFIKQ